MPKRTDITSILIIGSGPIVIGQACEFDYSGTQAVKALKEEGYRVILVNSNPATIMTDPNLADRTYIEPITREFVSQIIRKERPDALLPTIGGQTALNVTLELEESGIFEECGVKLIGASAEAIKTAEDRERFKEAVTRCGLSSAKSFICRDLETARRAAAELGYPLIIRPSRTLGGAGSGTVFCEEELEEKLRLGFSLSPIGELLLEESLIGWKEMELEIMRDCAGNAVVICGIENIDPMGVHTGDSITVAPIQTLTDKEYQQLRDGAIRLMNEIGVDTGGSNVQFAMCPRTGRAIVIELNPRVSRSSALASKATGFPIAKIAAKLAVGYTLDELPNDITEKTPACFEPSIDYVVVKIPRFDFEKFKTTNPILGTQMKSVGEVMAIGRIFPEALQKACRSLEVGRTGLLGGEESAEGDLEVLLAKIETLNPRRIFQIARAMELGASLEELARKSNYDMWFLFEMQRIVKAEKSLLELGENALSSREVLRELKRLGTSDRRIAKLCGVSEIDVASRRRELSLRPVFKTVDTCAAEFASHTPYLYSTYDSTEEGEVSSAKKVVILGGGPNRIGQGIEFDYCCVHAAMALRGINIETIMLNCNPETVSTDYDTSDRLYFEPLELEDVMEVVHRERPWGVIVQYGGQTPLRLANALKDCGVPIIGTSPEAIELTEDREKFKRILAELNLLQAENRTVSRPDQACQAAKEIGYPIVVRPSFVLGGRAMAIVYTEDELKTYIEESVMVSNERPVLIDRFLDNAIEIDVDAVCDGKLVVIAGIMEHVERAGIHSGDSSFMLPAQTLTDSVLAEVERASKILARACGVVGLMNVQFAVCGGKDVYVIEVNPRASRSVPFVSKVTGIPWAKVAARVMAGETLRQLHDSAEYGDILRFENYALAISDLNYVAVKESVFPFIKFHGVDALLGPEMRSTGEVMGIDRTFAGGFYRAQVAAGATLPLKGTVFLSLRDEDKDESLDYTRKLKSMGFKLVATSGTAQFLRKHDIEVESINKVREGSPHIVDALLAGEVDLVINTPEGSGPLLDSRTIRTTASDLRLPLFTTVAAARAAVEAIEQMSLGDRLDVLSLQRYLAQ
ncbi:MAG: carbamoyl-phosphate synthase large subunit [Deltaproteobacteria bacterium]|nr:carbamoyl-phosphate synthase large subunit [Deltaproteobacteria bacterium]